MAQNKNAKKSDTKPATRAKNAPQKTGETMRTKKTVAKKTAPKPAPKPAQKETRAQTRNASDYIIATVTVKIDRKTHTVAKRFAANKSPVAAVVAIMNTTRLPHIICWTQNAKSAAAHCRRVARQYVGPDAAIETRYASVVVIPCEIRAATDDDLLARATTEDRTWIRANRDAAGKNKTAANAAEMDA